MFKECSYTKLKKYRYTYFGPGGGLQPPGFVKLTIINVSVDLNEAQFICVSKSYKYNFEIKIIIL